MTRFSFAILLSVVIAMQLAATQPAQPVPTRRQPDQMPPNQFGGIHSNGRPPMTQSIPMSPSSTPFASLPPVQQQQLQAQFGMLPANKLTMNPQQQQQLQLQLQQQQQLQYQQQAQQTSPPLNPYTNATHTILLELRQQLITRAMKFDEHFRGLLSRSKMSLHHMFVATYGMMYELNTEIFANMYESLEEYYATGRVELSKSMESFFQRLYQKIFQVANSSRVFSPAYLECVTEQLTILKPFKDAPEKLISDIKHALVAARTLHQALNSAIDIIKSIISLGDPPQCVKLISDKLLRNQQPTSGTTRELPGISQLLSSAKQQQQQQQQQPQPCLAFCEQVILRCVGRANLEPLSERWMNFVSLLADLAKKLSVQYNIETIIGPIDVQISEAIMNFQDNAHNITDRVYAACGDAKPNNGMQPATLSDVAPMRSPAHNLLGKRSANLPPRMSGSTPTQSGSTQKSSVGQPSSARRVPPPVSSSVRQVDEQLVPAYERTGAMSSARMLTPTHSAAHSKGERLASSGMLGRAPALYDSYDEAGSNGGSPIGSPHRKSPVVIGDIKEFLLSTKNFWHNLPNSVCSMTLGLNGSISGPQLRRGSPQQNCFQETLEVYDMNMDLRYRQEIQHQVMRLDAMFSKILDALHGVEIDWSKVLDGVGTPNNPLDAQQQQQQQQQPNRPPQVPSVGTQAQRPPAIPSQSAGGATAVARPVSVADEEEEETDESTDEGNVSDNTGDEELDEEYPTSPSEDEDEDIEPHEEETPETTDELSSTTQPTEPGAPAENPIPTIEADNRIENDDKSQMNFDQSNDLITADPSPRKSSAGPGDLLLVIDRTSLLLLSIIYCALSVVIQNQFQPMARLQTRN